jgi:hypothetical protein
LSIAEGSSQCGDVNPETTFFNVRVGPHSGHQFFFCHKLSGATDQGGQNLPCSAAEAHRLIVFKEQLLLRQKAEWSERDALV